MAKRNISQKTSTFHFTSIHLKKLLLSALSLCTQQMLHNFDAYGTWGLRMARHSWLLQQFFCGVYVSTCVCQNVLVRPT